MKTLAFFLFPCTGWPPLAFRLLTELFHFGLIARLGIGNRRAAPRVHIDSTCSIIHPRQRRFRSAVTSLRRRFSIPFLSCTMVYTQRTPNALSAIRLLAG
jgi:hypothetical protein